jgi:hypothetical protein
VAVELFAGLPVSDYERAPAWYERLLGGPPTFLPNATEAVWELAGRGIDPAEQEIYSNAVRKVTYRDPDGNEIGFGGLPAGS